MQTINLVDRILVVDDDHLICYAITKALAPSFPEVKSVSNGHDALSEISACRYPLCFLDVSLPDLNGLHVMKKMKEISPETKVVIMTANIVDEDMKREIEGGSYNFLAKPFDISEVKAIARRALGKAKNGHGIELRHSERRPLAGTIDFSISLINLTHKGEIVDLSDTGLGIRTAYPLEPGHVLAFFSGIEQKAGVVKWSKQIDGNGIYRAGIKFISPDENK